MMINGYQNPIMSTMVISASTAEEATGELHANEIALNSNGGKLIKLFM
jgi:hypothetical protein